MSVESDEYAQFRTGLYTKNLLIHVLKRPLCHINLHPICCAFQFQQGDKFVIFTSSYVASNNNMRIHSVRA